MDAQARSDAIAALQLLVGFGADDALDDSPVDRRRAAFAAPAATGIATQERPAAAVARPPAARAGSPLDAARGEAAAAASLADLQRRLAGFTLCPLAATATKAAIADGNPASGLVFVGDVPGDAEDRSGRPFDGEAGALLDRMLAAIGLDRQRAYLLNMIPWRPPGGRAPNPVEIALCEPFLWRQLAFLQPRLIVALGNLPARVLTRETAAARKRGTWHAIAIEAAAGPIPLLVTHHPATLLATAAAKRDAWTDLQALRDKIATLSPLQI